MVRALLLLLAVLLWPAQALADVVHLLPTDPLVGDGQTPATIRVWIEGSKATDRVRLKPSDGTAGDAVLSADGIASFSFVPPRVSKPGTAAVRVGVRGSMKVDEIIEIPVEPPPTGFYSLSFEPEQFVQGRDEAVTIRITPDATSPVAQDARKVLVNASAGKVSEPTPGGDGTFVVRWTPPGDLDAARTAIIGVTDAAFPGDIVGWGTLPLLVERNTTFDVKPGSQNVLMVGERTYGPNQANPQGKVSFAVLVDPGQPKANLQTILGADKTEQVVDIDLDDYPRAHLLPLPPKMAADASHVINAWVYATKKTGEPLSNASVTLETTAGVTGTPVATGKPGLYKGSFKAPTGKPGTASLTATVEGHESKADIALAATVPTVALTVEPSQLPKGERDIVLTARVKDGKGTAKVGTPPLLEVEGARVMGEITDNEDGTYTAKLRMDPRAGGVSVRADSPVETSALVPAHITLLPTESVIAADGKSKVDVVIAVVDRFGLPVPNVAVSLAVPEGDGALPPRVITGDRGVARATYTAGSQAGPATLRAEAAGVWTAAPIFQRARVAPAENALTSGSQAHLARIQQWSQSMATATVSVEGEAPKAGPPAQVTLKTTPQFTTPGAAIQVTAKVTDAKGLPVAGQRLQVTASVGTAGKATDNGNGTYTATVQLPAGQDGPLQIGAKLGDLSTSVSLPTLASMGTAAAANSLAQPQQQQQQAQPSAPAQTQAQPTASVQTEQPTHSEQASPTPPPAAAPPSTPAPAKVDKPKAPRQSSGSPWGRASLGLAMVPHYYQATSSGEGDVPSEASFNNGVLTGGFAARVMLWPGDQSLGVEARVKGYRDFVEVGSQTIGSFATTALGGVRFRGDIDPDLQWFGFVGGHMIPALVFQYAEGSLSEAELARTTFYGARVGGGVMMGRGDLLVDAGLYETFAPTPAETALHGSAEYTLTDTLALRGALDLGLRTLSIPVRGEDVSVTDLEYGVNLGVSYLLF